MGARPMSTPARPAVAPPRAGPGRESDPAGGSASARPEAAPLALAVNLDALVEAIADRVVLKLAALQPAAEPPAPPRGADPLTVEAVASELQVTPATVRGWIRSGELRAFRVGPSRLWRVRRADLDAFEARRPSEPANDVDALAARIARGG
jgi:excisionase family DNA binding protein